MAKSSNGRQSSAPPLLRAITAISVEGFKSIDARQEIEVRPLTILAGVNSSGKSSMMQPLLLLKQTLEAPYDPGPLLLNGPNVRFTKVEQFLCRSRTHDTSRFVFGLTVGENDTCDFHLRNGTSRPVELDQIHVIVDGRESTYREETTELTTGALDGLSIPQDILDVLRKNKVRVHGLIRR